jgi:hypothetical protein
LRIVETYVAVLGCSRPILKSDASRGAVGSCTHMHGVIGEERQKSLRDCLTVASVVLCRLIPYLMGTYAQSVIVFAACRTC